MNRRPLSLAVCLIVPFVILLAGLGMAGWQGYHSFLELVRESGRGPLPPGFSVEITESGKHTLWLHTYTIHDGTAFESGERLPAGAKVILTDEATGKALDLNPYFAASKSSGSESAVSLGTFEARAATKVSVMGTGIAKPVILSVAPAKVSETIRAVLVVLGIGLMSFFLAVTSLIVLLHRRQKMMKAEEQMHAHG